MKMRLLQCKSYWIHSAKSTLLAVLVVVGFWTTAGIAYSEEIPPFKDHSSGNAVFDFRTDDPSLALIYLNLIGDTFNDQDVREASSHPDFVVNFGGRSVRLLAKEIKNYSEQDKKAVENVKHKITALAKEGIRFDYCLYGGRLFGVEPDNVPGMNTVDNGWVSLIRYQAKGYSVVPAF